VFVAVSAQLDLAFVRHRHDWLMWHAVCTIVSSGRWQVSAPLSALRTLGYFLQDRMRPQEQAAQDLVDNMVIQGDRLQEVAEQLQVRIDHRCVSVTARKELLGLPS
jgi:hypothetical protein